MTIYWIEAEFFFPPFLRKKVTGKLVFKSDCVLRKQTKPKQTLHGNSLCTFLRKEEINQSQTSISVCIPLAAHVFQLMKSVHGSPVIDFREALICRLRSGSSRSLFPAFFPPPPFSFSLPSASSHIHKHISSWAVQLCLGYHIERWLQWWGNPAGQTV